MSKHNDPRDKVQPWREGAGITQAELARRIGVHPSMICQIESSSIQERKFLGYVNALRLREISGGQIELSDVMSPEQFAKVADLAPSEAP